MSVVKSAPLFILAPNLYQPEYLLSACICVTVAQIAQENTECLRSHARESPRLQARGHTGVPQVTSVTGPQAQTLDRSATSSTDPTAPLFAKSRLPDMGIYTLFMVAQQVCLPLRTDV